MHTSSSSSSRADMDDGVAGANTIAGVELGVINNELTPHDQRRLLDMLNEQQLDTVFNAYFERRGSAMWSQYKWRLYIALITTFVGFVGLALFVAVEYTDLRNTITDLKSGEALKRGSVSSDALADDAVSSSKVADGSISATDLADGAILSSKLAPGAVLTSKIGDREVRSANIGDGAVTTEKLADAAVTSAKMGSGAVRSEHIRDSEIITSKLNDDAVTTAKIKDGDVSTAKLADGAVDSFKLRDLAVSSGKLADSSVLAPKLADGAVSTPKLADGAVSTPKLADGAVNGSKLADDAVTGAKLAQGAVSAENFAAGAVLTGIAAGTLPYSKADSSFSGSVLRGLTFNFVEVSYIANLGTGVSINDARASAVVYADRRNTYPTYLFEASCPNNGVLISFTTWVEPTSADASVQCAAGWFSQNVKIIENHRASAEWWDATQCAKNPIGTGSTTPTTVEMDLRLHLVCVS